MVWRYLRLQSLRADAADNRSAERYRRAAWGAVGNVAARLAAMAAMVLSIHWFAPVLGPERFGVWAIFAGLAATLSFLDLGIGNALINRVAHAAASGEKEIVRSTVTAGIGWLGVAALFASCGLAALAVGIPWGSLLKLSEPSLAQEAQLTAIAFSLLFGLHTLSSGTLKVLIGQQRSHEAHAMSVVAAAIAVLVLWVHSDDPVSVPWLLAMTFGIPAASGLPALFVLSGRDLFSPSLLRSSMHAHGKELVQAGSLFVLLQMGTMVGWGLDALILGATSGAAAVAALTVAQRLFQFASQPVAILNAPLWAAYADARATADAAFVRRTLVRSMAASVLLGIVLSTLLWTAGPSLITKWTQESIDVASSLMLAMAAWTLIECAGIAFGTYLNGTGIVREQVIVVTVFCLVALPLKLWASNAFGATGLVTVTMVTYLAVVVLLYSTMFRNQVLAPIRGIPR